MVLSPYKEDYLQIFKYKSFCLTAVVGRFGARQPVYHTSWIAVVTPTDRHKSVCTSLCYRTFGDVFALSLFFLFFVGVEDFVIGLSKICDFSVNNLITSKSKTK